MFLIGMKHSALQSEQNSHRIYQAQVTVFHHIYKYFMQWSIFETNQDVQKSNATLS